MFYILFSNIKWAVKVGCMNPLQVLCQIPRCPGFLYSISRWWFQTFSPTAGFVRHDKSVDRSVVSNISYFHPYLGKWSNLTIIFFRWVVQPPTRFASMTCWRWILRRHAEKKAQSRQGSKQKWGRWTMKFCPFSFSVIVTGHLSRCKESSFVERNDQREWEWCVIINCDMSNCLLSYLLKYHFKPLSFLEDHGRKHPMCFLDLLDLLFFLCYL